MTRVSETLNLGEFLDGCRPGRFHLRLLVLCLCVLIFDGFDIVSMGYIAPAIIHDWGITAAQLTPVMTAGLFGLTLGALLGGPLADRFGRRRIIIGSVLFFGVMSLASAWAPNLTILASLRFLTGLGLGASQPNTGTLISEFAPRRRRALFVTIVYCGFTIGAALGGFLSAALITAFSWQSILIVGGALPCLFSLLLIKALPESARFLSLKPEAAPRLRALINDIRPGSATSETRFVVSVPAERGSVLRILAPQHLSVTLLLWLGVTMTMLSVYLLNSWLPVMIHDTGISLGTAAVIGAMMQFGGTLGTLLLGWEMDRWEPNRVMIATLLGAAITCAALGLLQPSQSVQIALIIVIGFLLNSANTGWVALATSYYHTEMRATGTGWMTALGRVGAIIGATSGALVLGLGWGLAEVFRFLAVPMLLCALVVSCKARVEARSDRRQHSGSEVTSALQQRP